MRFINTVCALGVLLTVGFRSLVQEPTSVPVSTEDQAKWDQSTNTGFVAPLADQIAYQQSRTNGEPDLKTLAELKSKAEKGDAAAQFALFTRYLETKENSTNASHWLYAAARQGYPKAELMVGILCLSGITNEAVPIDFSKAGEPDLAKQQVANSASVDWIKKSAEHNDRDAEIILSGMYQYGRGVTTNGPESLSWLLKAAENKDETNNDTFFGKFDAMLGLGDLYADGEIIPKNMTESVKWYRKAAEAGSRSGQLTLARIYCDGMDPSTNSSAAITWLQMAAEQDVRVAKYQLGQCFENGIGVPRNSEAAIKWYQAATNFGPAEVRLGEIYQDGIGVPTNIDESGRRYCSAANWEGWNGTNYYFERTDCEDLYGKHFDWSSVYRRLLNDVDRSEPKVEFAFGSAFFHKEDSGKMVEWFEKSANRGDASAALRLATMFRTGTNYWQSVPKDANKAIQWDLKAAEEGFAEGYVEIGRMYEDGDGVAKNCNEALKWYLKAASQEITTNSPGTVIEMRIRLAVMYSEGACAPQDFIEAYKWANLEAARGDQEMAYTRDELAKRMTPEQISEAQRLCREFTPIRPDGSGSGISDGLSATGSGFLITEDGYFISNYHVVKGANKVRVTTSQGTVDANVVQVDVANDLALLKAKGHFAALSIASSRKVQLGSTVATVGFPNPGLQGFSPKLAKGEIAALAGAGDDARYFQISLPVQPGNSGGALVDERGNVVGVVSAKLDAKAALEASGSLPENVNYAVKSSFLLSFLESVPAVSAKLKDPLVAERKFEETVKTVQEAAVMVLVY